MKIHNIRFGHATNSSSSHSFIFDPSIDASHEDYDRDGFGWDFFTLVTREAKQTYMAAMLDANLARTKMSQTFIRAILKGLELPTDVGYGIDHQSVYMLPTDFGSNQISLEFFEEFRQYITRNGVVVLGGNDNEDTIHELKNDKPQLSAFELYRPETGPYTCRKDGDWWTLYHTESGTRIVLSFEDNPTAFDPKTPMLMDVKITDFCTHGCAYCYQGSTPNGAHMNPEKIWSFANKVHDAKVFEIAIGGGEPTQFPSFAEFVKTVAEGGVSVNFTTRSTDWLEDESRANTILPYIGAFAFSADEKNYATIERIYDIFKYRKYDTNKFTVQIVPAAINEHTFKTILKLCNRLNVRVTLLGFKDTGRGSAFKEIAIKRSWNKFDEKSWIKSVAELNATHNCPVLSIDTTLAGRYENDIKDVGIPSWLYHITEGQYSMYIDLVAKKCGPSSYHLDRLIDVNDNDDIESMFNRIEQIAEGKNQK